MIDVKAQAIQVDEHDVSVCNRSDIIDRLGVMKMQERTIYRIDDYIGRHLMTNSACKVDAYCRYKMAQWCFTLVDLLKLDRETVYIAMNYLDRFLSGTSSRSRRAAEDLKEYQLVSMTALYMSIKVFAPRIVHAEELAALSRGQYNSADIIRMESDMLSELEWHINGPTAVSFVAYILTLLPPMKDECGSMCITNVLYDSLFTNARYQIELSVAWYEFVTENPSTIAVAALINSIERVISDNKFLQARILHEVGRIMGINVQLSDLRHIAQRLSEVENDPTPIFDKRSNEDNTIIFIDEGSELRGRKSTHIQATTCTKEISSPTACM